MQKCFMKLLAAGPVKSPSLREYNAQFWGNFTVEHLAPPL